MMDKDVPRRGRKTGHSQSQMGSNPKLRDGHGKHQPPSIRHSIPAYTCTQTPIQQSHFNLQQSDVNAGIISNQTVPPLSTSSGSPMTQSLILKNSHSSIGNVQSITDGMDDVPSVTRRHHNASGVTITNKVANVSQRISSFEPYPMRDTIQHFCEKHLEKIKDFMLSLSSHIPPPAKCTVEERRAKKTVKLHFACQGRGEHCLYKRTFFTIRTRYPKIWIHLMFLTLQARSQSALSSRHASVTSLKNCWDILKCENRTFLTLVTSAFPCVKDQDMIMNELRRSGFCDVFECTPAAGDASLWRCFLCNHPERAMGFLQDTQPVIEGQLKEKKGRWKLFKRWKTRYFTLSGAHLSYKESKNDKEGTPIEVHQIRSVKVSRGARNIPKAFEIFTGDRSLILKSKRGKNVEEWVQCLSIVVAHSQANPSRSSSLVRGAI